jgi:hypothetical protein
VRQITAMPMCDRATTMVSADVAISAAAAVRFLALPWRSRWSLSPETARRRSVG